MKHQEGNLIKFRLGKWLKVYWYDKPEWSWRRKYQFEDGPNYVFINLGRLAIWIKTSR